MTKLIGYITPHFSWREILRSQTAARRKIKNIPGTIEQSNIVDRLCPIMEHVRAALFQNRIRCTSGFRSNELNKAIGGSKTSVHPKGLAMDFDCAGFGDEEAVYNRLLIFMVYAKILEEGVVIRELSPQDLEIAQAFRQIDQMIFEYEEWIHIGLSEGTPRLQCFIKS